MKICLLISLFFLSSCIIVNNSRGQSSTCEVHHQPMHRCIVGTNFGLRAYGPSEIYPNAKEKQNMGCVVQPWPIYRLAIMYHCPVCDSLKKSETKK
ncbi:MAG TPA: hypothetical protein VI112_05480 [Bacteroidia bacterium]|jgi:hypothetical protein